MMKANTEQLNYINAYFSECEWELDNDAKVIVFDTIEEVVSYFGFDTTGLSFDELENLIDDKRNVWFDGEHYHCYFVIVQ